MRAIIDTNLYFTYRLNVIYLLINDIWGIRSECKAFFELNQQIVAKEKVTIHTGKVGTIIVGSIF
jgi:hypothetical protein